ncbi:bifunctional [glutamate--ammonia ligase]-adenylyl-L-tyrosine phosphorylase/[glutamate--ammonia-ligase] adenylyltransferase [Thaumasiovibrio subtropicus]|uniref:bifunctional [glutamate--ammonia ligase]-adenylyl-L-tyrosine phosphorylase/[glutamate--ammonia-ligase] adenylyltransferase n=1 Tax=Thaumasiovibrio subtropicus TaxID=1891207 RepID=UPI000B34E778|nr:bifunctional [glutamate--ammonia ligase]-adenylyl-L-tyrosine phosphorylase/[glutamate--ammonia-ligase] adenylyltransferase [Thaumasiovibrio subtropicus]
MTLPSLMAQAADKHWQHLQEQHPEVTTSLSAEQQASLLSLMGYSDFIANSVIQQPSLAEWYFAAEQKPEKARVYRTRLANLLAEVNDEPSLMRVLRRFRREEMVLLAAHDFLGKQRLEISLARLSELAEAIIMEAYHWLYSRCCQEWGTPTNDEGEAQPMLVLGMGKLGGGELNFSSDIDLIFTYPDNGETVGARRSIANAQFFTRLGQRLIKALDQQTFDGFCYRVDMRLRPFGDSGPLVMSYAALEDYYQEQGRDWERYAMIKARVMGRESFSRYQELRQMLRPFVFRRYIDFSAVQSLRRMKAMISSEVRRRGLHNNIKLGPGGIREVEFIAQSFQLIRGGRTPQLRGRGLLETLKAIAENGLLPAEEVDVLRAGYCFLRRVENLLQAINDTQTQTLPDKPLDQWRLAHALGCSDWSALEAEITGHMAAIHQVFDDLIGDDEQEQQGSVEAHFQEIWDMARNEDVLLTIFNEFSFVQPSQLCQHLLNVKQELSKRTLGQRGREVLNRLMPSLLSHILPRDDAPLVLNRILELVIAIATRTTYLELLAEHNNAQIQLVRLCAASTMIAEQLARYPILLDELLDPNQLYHPIPLEQYRDELREYLARIPEEDMEQQMEGIRQFKQTQLLRIAAADIAGVLPVMKVSDHLTYLAEAIVDAVISQAWFQTASKYGSPSYLKERGGRGFAVIGYGKVGGWELGYNSDLDIVFLTDCPANDYTDGDKQIDSRQFYVRLAQRVVHLFSTRTTTGVLYEIDTRLRPSGASGLLVSTVEAFEEYQHQDAWTWEHQALVRTRMIYGDMPLAQAFSKARKGVLRLAREPEKLRQDVVEMREKMRDHLGGKKAGRFMIKQDAGGITDIEFIAQYLVLNHAKSLGALTKWSDNVRIFEMLAECEVIGHAQAQAVINAYTGLRDEIHRLNLRGLDADVAGDQFETERDVVKAMWQQYLIDC